MDFRYDRLFEMDLESVDQAQLGHEETEKEGVAFQVRG